MPNAGDEGEDLAARSIAQPFVRGGTLLQRIDGPAEEMTHLRDSARGSYVGGSPYLERGEEWPHCGHGLPMKSVLQVDTRDAIHRSTVPGLFVVYDCAAGLRTRFASFKTGRDCLPIVRYYAEPNAERRQVVSWDAATSVQRLVPTKKADFLPPPELVQTVAPRLVAMERAHYGELWGPAYWRMMKQTGMWRALFEDHFGGWHNTNPDRNYVPPPCACCGESPQLVVQLEWGDGNLALWACPTHPSQTHFALHK